MAVLGLDIGFVGVVLVILGLGPVVLIPILKEQLVEEKGLQDIVSK